MKEDDDGKSRTIASSNNGVKKLEKEIKTTKKHFHSVNTQLAKLQESNFDISDSDTEEESHFQHAKRNVGKHSFQFAQLDAEFEPQISQLFKQSSKSRDTAQLYLREIIILDSQSTMDIFCNIYLVDNINNPNPQCV